MGPRSGQWELWTVESDDRRKTDDRLRAVPDAGRRTRTRTRSRSSGRGSAASRWFSLWTLDLVDGEGPARDGSRRQLERRDRLADLEPRRQEACVRDDRRAGRTTVGAKPVGQQDIWTINADGTNRHRLTDGNGMNLTPFWAADNRVYFVSNRGGTECVWSAAERIAAA